MILLHRYNECMFKYFLQINCITYISITNLRKILTNENIFFKILLLIGLLLFEALPDRHTCICVFLGCAFKEFFVL